MSTFALNRFQYKRLKVTVACDTCRKKKVKCDGTHPKCGRCLTLNLQCSYIDVPKKRGPPKAYPIFHGKSPCQNKPTAASSSSNFAPTATSAEHGDAKTTPHQQQLQAESSRLSPASARAEGLAHLVTDAGDLYPSNAQQHNRPFNPLNIYEHIANPSDSSSSSPISPLAKAPVVHAQQPAFLHHTRTHLPIFDDSIPLEKLPSTMPGRNSSLSSTDELFDKLVQGVSHLKLFEPQYQHSPPSHQTERGGASFSCCNDCGMELTCAECRRVSHMTFRSASPLTHSGHSHGDGSQNQFDIAFNASTPIERLIPQDLSHNLLYCYFHHFQCMIPMLPEPLYLTKWKGDPYHNPLLLCAVYAVGALYTQDVRVTHFPVGTQTPGEAFYHRAKQSLTEAIFNETKPSLSMIQAALLLCFRDYLIGRPIKAHALCSMANSMAVTLNLYREPEDSALAELEGIFAEGEQERQSESLVVAREIRRRVTWTLFVLDRWLSASTSRPVIVDLWYIDTDLPELEDEELCELEKSRCLPEAPLHSPAVTSSESSFGSGSVKIFRYQTRLSKILGDILRHLYHLPQYQISKHVFEELEANLAKWYGDVSHELRLTPEFISISSSRKALLLISYFTVQILLYRPLLKLHDSTVYYTSHFSSQSMPDLRALYNADKRPTLERTSFSHNYSENSETDEAYAICNSAASLITHLAELVAGNGANPSLYNALFSLTTAASIHLMTAATSPRCPQGTTTRSPSRLLAKSLRLVEAHQRSRLSTQELKRIIEELLSRYHIQLDAVLDVEDEDPERREELDPMELEPYHRGFSSPTAINHGAAHPSSESLDDQKPVWPTAAEGFFSLKKLEHEGSFLQGRPSSQSDDMALVSHKSELDEAWCQPTESATTATTSATTASSITLFNGPVDVIEDDFFDINPPAFPPHLQIPPEQNRSPTHHTDKGFVAFNGPAPVYYRSQPHTRSLTASIPTTHTRNPSQLFLQSDKMYGFEKLLAEPNTPERMRFPPHIIPGDMEEGCQGAMHRPEGL
ncbi:uncharacterized protein VTP21DRAFT_9962 [Calcarisporiella thermophila]|uniref:uncharacterized protein n=1 Tax=Calcarisporiella thermophila TaxID=911321 RepID=UPI0037448792